MQTDNIVMNITFHFRMYLQYAIAFQNQNTTFYTIPNPVAKSFVQMIMSKGFPPRDKINYKIRLAHLPASLFNMLVPVVFGIQNPSNQLVN